MELQKQKLRICRCQQLSEKDESRSRQSTKRNVTLIQKSHLPHAPIVSSFVLAYEHIRDCLLHVYGEKPLLRRSIFQHFEFQKQINLHSKNVSEKFIQHRKSEHFQLLCAAISVPFGGMSMRTGFVRGQINTPFIIIKIKGTGGDFLYIFLHYKILQVPFSPKRRRFSEMANYSHVINRTFSTLLLGLLFKLQNTLCG